MSREQVQGHIGAILDSISRERVRRGAYAERLLEGERNLHRIAHGILETFGRPTRDIYPTDDYDTRLVTPIVQVEIDGKEVGLQLRENWLLPPLGDREDAYITLSGEMIFHIGPHRTTNWFNDRATIEQQQMASEILAYISHSLILANPSK